MDDREFIVELVKYVSWPVVTGAGIYFLKDKVSGIFGGGIKSARHGETEFQFFEGKQEFKPKDPENQNIHNLIPTDPTGLREDVEENISSQLVKIESSDEKIDILVKNLAQQQIANAFDRIYHAIFGSQIRLLEFLSVQQSGAAPAEAVLPFFERTRNENPDAFKSYHFSDYMNFLVSWSLVGHENGVWSITKHGRAFLLYITAMQMNKNKVL